MTALNCTSRSSARQLRFLKGGAATRGQAWRGPLVTSFHMFDEDYVGASQRRVPRAHDARVPVSHF
jgi:hypothetical protein